MNTQKNMLKLLLLAVAAAAAAAAAADAAAESINCKNRSIFWARYLQGSLRARVVPDVAV